MKPMTPNEPNPALKTATGFLLLFLCAGIFLGVARAISEIGLRPETIQSYYLGSEESMTYPKEFPELMETLHVHFFMIPVIYYILCYFFAQTRVPSGWKIVLIGLCFTNIAGFLMAPFMVRYFSPGFAVMFPVHEFLLIITALLLTYYSIKEVTRDL
jgi:hypothetical protein